MKIGTYWTVKQSENLSLFLNLFLGEREANSIHRLLKEGNIDFSVIQEKLKEFETYGVTKKTNFIETNKFKDENALNLFITNVIDCRKAQEAETQHRANNIRLDTEAYRIVRDAKETLEAQLDRKLAALPPIHSIFL